MNNEYPEIRVPVNEDSLSIKLDSKKCIYCTECINVCKNVMNVYGSYDLNKAICIDCGQCTQVCPTRALTVKEDYLDVLEEIEKGKIVVFQTAPSVRISLGEEYGLNCSNVSGKLVTVLKKLGASYVFDTVNGADLTVIEEANELYKRIKNKEVLPMFTSCCPSWVKFVEVFYPEYINNLSTCKSPILMLGSIIKTYFADIKNIDSKNIINVALTPCSSKKAEIKRGKEIDYVITVKELVKLLKEKNIDFNSLEDSNYDSILGNLTGSGVIFGNTGGVMESTLRTLYHLITNEYPQDKFLNLESVRGLNGVKEDVIKIGDINLKIAVVQGTMNASKFLHYLSVTHNHYDFIEVMACPGGCIGGAGQPKKELIDMEKTRIMRMSALYEIDSKATIRNSFENENIIKLYNDYLGKPLGQKSIELLHTSYEDKSSILK